MPLFAYFDPGSGSLLAQAIVGGGAGLLVIVRYMWDRLRNPPSGAGSNRSSVNTQPGTRFNGKD